MSQITEPRDTGGPAFPGLEVCEATHEDFVSSMAGLIDLQPLPKVLPVYPSKQLPCAAVNREEREYLRRVAVRDGLRRAA